MSDFVSVREAAERLDISTRTLHRMLDAGEIPWTYLGKLRRIPRADFEEYIQARTDDARAFQQQRKVVPLERVHS